MRALIIVGLSLFSVNAAAEFGFLVEPILGYESGKLEQSATYNGVLFHQMALSLKGVTFGARAGVNVSMLSLGVDYRSGSMNDSKVAGEPGIKPKDLGAFAMVNLPLGIRVWGIYMPQASTKGLKGSGYSAGLGLRPFTFFSINGEYVARKYDELDGESNIPAGATVDTEVKTTRITVSFPIDI